MKSSRRCARRFETPRDELVKGGLRRGFVLLTLGQIAFLVSGYATHISLARGLGPAEYGTYGVLLSVLSTVALVLTAGMPEAIAKFAAERPSDAGAIFAQGIGIQFRFSLVLSVAYAICSPLIAWALHDRTLGPELLLSALAIPPVALYAVAVGALNGEQRFGAQALTVGGYGMLRAALVIALARHLQIWGAVSGFVLSPLIVVSLVLPAILRRRSAHVLESRTLWVFARPVIAFSVALAFLMNLDLFMVKSLVRDPNVVGYYAAAATIAKVPYFFFSALGVVLLPIVSSAGAGKDETILARVQKAIRLTFAAAVGVAAVVVPLSQAVLRTLYGQRYTIAALPLALLVIGSTLFTLTQILAYALNGLGRPKMAMRLTLGGLCVEAVLAFVLTSKFGAAGAAGAACLSSAGILALLARAAKPHLGSILPMKTVLRVSLAFAGTVLVGVHFAKPSPFSLCLSLPLSLGNLLFLIVTREFTFGDLGSWLRRAET